MKNLKLSYCFSLLLFLSFNLWAGPLIHYVTDLEGRKGNIDALIEQGKLKIEDGKLNLTDPDAQLVFGGDLVDRGPDSIKLRKWLVDLKERHPDKVTLIWGNRDLNKLSLARALVELDTNMHDTYKGWLKKQLAKEGKTLPEDDQALALELKKNNTKTNQVLWWTENNGIPNALEFHRQELEELSGKKVSLPEAALDMAKSLDPKKGEYFRYLELGQFGRLEGETIFVHGGVSKENYRVVPGSPDRAETPKEWIDKLNKWGQAQLSQFRNDLADKKKDTSKLLLYGDAVWDSSVNQVMASDQSVVYPYRVKENGNFRLPADEVTDWLKKNGVNSIVVGHSPVGNVPVPLRDTGFLYMHADTSYTSAGIHTTVDIKDGVVHVQGQTGNGAKLDYKVSSSTPAPIGFQTGENVVIGTTEDGKYILYRYYDGYKIEEKVVDLKDIDKSTLKAPKTEVNQEQIAQEKTVREALQKKGKHVLQSAEELDNFYGNKKPILFSGASKLSFDDGSENKVRQVVISMLDSLNKDENVIVTGGTDYGVEKIVHEEAKKRGFQTVGFSSAQSAPEGFNLVDRVHFAGSDWDSPLQRAIDYVKAKNGQSVFIGGGGVVKRGIEYANSVGANFHLMSDVPGASQDLSKSLPNRSFSSDVNVFAKKPAENYVTARVLRGKSGTTDFDYLSPPASERKIVFLMDGNGLSEIEKSSGYDVLKKIGYTDTEIQKYQADGIEFKLAVLPAQDGVTPATWDNLIPMLRATYPEIADKIANQLEELKKASGPEGYAKIMSHAPADALKIPMDAARLAKSEGSLWEVRKFLHDQLNLNQLYMGDGYTYSLNENTKKLEKGVKEFFAVNRPLKDFSSASVKELKVSSPERIPASSKTISKEDLVKKAEASKPTKIPFVKDAPVLAYRITSDRFEDIPEAIRKHLGEVDKTKYTSEYLKQNVGSVFALQMNGDKPDFYVIGKATFDSKYESVPMDDVAKKNGKYLAKVSGQLGDLAASKDANLISVLKTTPTEMIKMSDLGYPLDKEVVIESPWGDQTKPAGKDAFLVWDDAKKQYYMVNVGEDGNPLSYIKKTSQPAYDCASGFASLLKP